MKTKAVGAIRRVDELGRIVIPKDLRKAMGIATDTPMEIVAQDNAIILTKYEAVDNALTVVQHLRGVISLADYPKESLLAIIPAINHVEALLKGRAEESNAI